MTLRTAALPKEYEFIGDWSSKPTLHAAYTPSGWVVSAAQRGVRSVLGIFGRELEPLRTRVVASARECSWDSVHPLPLRDGGCILGVAGLVRESLVVDLETLATAPGPSWVTRNERPTMVTQLAALGDRYVFVLTDDSGVDRLMAMPADASAAPAAFFADFAGQLEAQGNMFAGDSSKFDSVIAWDETLLLTHRYPMRTRPRGHALLAVNADGQLLRQRPLTEKSDRARFLARDICWLPDVRSRQLLLYGGGVLEALDEQLVSLVRVDGHALFKACRPIATDGAGSLLWYDARARRLAATDAEDLDVRALKGSLDRLLKAYKASNTASKGGRKVRAKASPIARPALDLAFLDSKYYRRDRDELLAVERESPETVTINTLEAVHRIAQQVVAHASGIPRDQHVMWGGVRLAAQAATGLLAAQVEAGGPDHVSVAFAGHTLTLPTTVTLMHQYEWGVAWDLASIVRDQACLEVLASIPDCRVYTHVEAYTSAWRAARVAFAAQPASALPELVRLHELAQPHLLRYAGAGATLNLFKPLFAMLQALAVQDAAAFQSALVNALTWHKKQYGTPSQRLKAPGMLAWSALALCCRAYDLKLAFDADTDYLPRALIERRVAADHASAT